MEATLDVEGPADARRPVGRSKTGATLCVHFGSRGSGHSIWYADAGEGVTADLCGLGRVSIAWRELPGPLLRGQVVVGRDVACDCFLLLGGDAREDQDMLRAQGVARNRAALLARMPQRPLLATIARGGELHPATLRGLHRLAVAAALAARAQG